MFGGLYLVAESVSLRGIEVAVLPLVLLIIFGSIIFLPAAFFRRWYFYRRRLKKNIITAEYEPPLGLNPAELGYMFDGKLREEEVGATVIHLLQRRLLHVKKIDKNKYIFAGPEVEDDLKAYEKKLVDEANKPQGVKASDLISRFTTIRSKNNNIALMSREFMFTQFVHGDLVRRQYVRASANYIFFAGALRIAALLIIFTVFLPLVGVWIILALQNGSTDLSTLFTLVLFGVFFSVFFFLPFFLAGIALNYFRGRIVGREWIITPRLKRLWPQIVGFRQYVKLVENERLVFQTEELGVVSKNETLPYAVALGFVKNWRDIIS